MLQETPAALRDAMSRLVESREDGEARMEWPSKWLTGGFVLAGLSALLIWAFLAGRAEQAAERERERPITAPQRISRGPRGEIVVTLDPAPRRGSGSRSPRSFLQGPSRNCRSRHAPGRCLPCLHAPSPDGGDCARVQRGG